MPTEFDPCSKKKCYNGGTCEVIDKEPKCNCDEPYEGESCLRKTLNSFEHFNINQRSLREKSVLRAISRHDLKMYHP